MKLLPSCIAIVLGTAVSVAFAQELPADPGAKVTTSAPASDPEVAAAQVSKALKEAKGVPARDITVATHASAVVLTGEVDTEAQRVAAQSVAENAAGGVRLNSNLQVRPLEDRPLKDQLAVQQSAQLVREVQSALKADSRTANLGVAVLSADPGIVVLQGLVPTRENRTTVQDVVSRAKGVTRVDNRLQIPQP
ncbi:MAG: BON domain-containing protein [Pseudomonadota bacterium]